MQGEPAGESARSLYDDQDHVLMSGCDIEIMDALALCAEAESFCVQLGMYSKTDGWERLSNTNARGRRRQAVEELIVFDVKTRQTEGAGEPSSRRDGEQQGLLTGALARAGGSARCGAFSVQKRHGVCRWRGER
jgi:hypothetical protein